LKSILSILAGALVLGLAACTDKASEATAENPALAAPVPAGMIRGTVVEAMDAAGYTYVLLDTSEGQLWFATQPVPVAVGDIVQTDTGLAMEDFTSRALGRSFDVIYFAERFQNLSAGAAPEGSPQTGLPAGHPVKPAQVDDAIAVAAFEEGKDIAWVYANRDSLAGQTVTLRGQVVKYNANILGTNFLHIRDGSGDAADGSNDMIVTTQAEVAVGQTIVVSGTVVLDKDYGAGYSYPLLVEEATVTVE
jgi:hypothetical protein